MWHKNRYAFTVKFDLCVFGCFAPSVEKIRIKFDLCVFTAVLVFALKRRLRFGFGCLWQNIKCTRLIKFDLITTVIGTINLLLP